MPRNHGNHVVPSASLDYHFLPTGKVGKNGEGELLVIGDYKYRVKVQTASGRRYWECSQRQCSAKAITSGAKLISYVEQHVHTPGAAKPQQRHPAKVAPAGQMTAAVATAEKSRQEDGVRELLTFLPGRSGAATADCAFSNLAFVRSEYPSFVYNPRPIVFPSPIPMEPCSEDTKTCLDSISEPVEGPEGAAGESCPTSRVNSNLSGLPNGTPRGLNNDSILLAPYEYIRKAPGKAVRSKMSLAFNQWLNIPDDKLKSICEIVEMLHNASLIIDDIEDRSVLRRGIPVAHKVFGTASCINSANFIYFLGLDKCLQLKNTEAITIFTEQMLTLHRGQGLDIHWRDSQVCPTEEEYRQMVIWKTGGLFGLAIRLMQLFSEDERDFQDLLNNLGLFFQIRDDYANLIATEYHDAKTYCEDLTEGKYSFPIVHAIHAHPGDQEVISILRQRTTDVDVKRYCVRHLHKLGALAYTKATLTELEGTIRRLVDRFGGNSHLTLLVNELSKLYRSEPSALEGCEEEDETKD